MEIFLEEHLRLPVGLLRKLVRKTTLESNSAETKAQYFKALTYLASQYRDDFIREFFRYAATVTDHQAAPGPVRYLHQCSQCHQITSFCIDEVPPRFQDVCLQINCLTEMIIKCYQ